MECVKRKYARTRCPALNAAPLALSLFARQVVNGQRFLPADAAILLHEVFVCIEFLICTLKFGNNRTQNDLYQKHSIVSCAMLTLTCATYFKIYSNAYVALLYSHHYQYDSHTLLRTSGQTSTWFIFDLKPKKSEPAKTTPTCISEMSKKGVEATPTLLAISGRFPTNGRGLGPGMPKASKVENGAVAYLK